MSECMNGGTLWEPFGQGYGLIRCASCGSICAWQWPNVEAKMAAMIGSSMAQGISQAEGRQVTIQPDISVPNHLEVMPLPACPRFGGEP